MKITESCIYTYVNIYRYIYICKNKDDRVILRRVGRCQQGLRELELYIGSKLGTVSVVKQHAQACTPPHSPTLLAYR